MTRLEALMAINDDHVESLKRQIAALKRDQYLMVRAMLTGSEMTILGKPVELTVSWPEGAPGTNDEILDCIKSWKGTTP